MKRILTILAVVLLTLALLSGCATPAAVQPSASPSAAAAVTTATPSPSTAPQAQDFPKKVTDIQGNAIDIPKKPERIISMSPSTTEILFAIGAGDKVIGIDKYSDYPDAVKTIAQVGDYTTPDVEKIISLKPDLVLAGEKLQTATITKLKELGIPTMAVEARNYEDISKSFEMIGAAVGQDTAAKALADKLKAKEDEIKGKLAGQKTPTVYYIVSFGAAAGNWTSGPGSFINSMIGIAGGDCVTNHVDPNAPWMDYNLEKLVSQNPDIMLLDQYAGDLKTLATTEGYKDLAAVKNGKVTVTTNELARPGPRIIDGLDVLAKILHPDLFK